jgi:Bacterial type II/III secretion system short domain
MARKKLTLVGIEPMSGQCHIRGMHPWRLGSRALRLLQRWRKVNLRVLNPGELMHQSYGHRRLFFMTIVLLLSFFLTTGQSLGKTTVIRVEYRWAAEVVPVVKHFLSPDGIVTVDERTNSLIITDREDVIANIHNFLTTFDTPAKRVRIRMRLNEEKTSRDSELSAGGGVSGNHWRIAVGDSEYEGIEIKVKEDRIEGKQSQEYMVQTTSGQKAYIVTGTKIPYRQRWRDYCNRYGGCTKTVMFHTADTGMEITAVIAGDHANIEITPRISRFDSDDPRGIIYFAGAATRITVPLGQWVSIGGADRKSNEVLREILGGGSAEANESLSMSIMVEIY